MSASPTRPAPRCARHPARPAHDRCPRCHRPRCDADARRYAAGCAACEEAGRASRPAGRLEIAVRAGLASFPVILAGGWIATQYVYDHIFAELLPGLVGLACGFAVNVVLPRRERRAGWVAASVAAAAAVLAAALGFRLVPGGRQSVVQPFSVVAAPYLSAIIGSVLWPLLFAPRRAD